MGEEAQKVSNGLVQKLRKAGLSTERDYLDKKMKGQFKAANRLHSKYVAILGDEEIQKNEINIKNMNTGEQEAITLAEVDTYLCRKLKEEV